MNHFGLTVNSFSFMKTLFNKYFQIKAIDIAGGGNFFRVHLVKAIL